MEFKDTDRYDVYESEDYESGSDNQVLKNCLGIKSKDLMDQLEARELEHAELATLEQFDENHQFTVNNICRIHKLWLGDIYPFAGKFRSVNMSKDGFPFAGASRISQCMKTFEKEFLAKYTPCHFIDNDRLAFALGVVHVEFILIHPFREGNGRVGRLLAVLMALQARKPPLDFSVIDQTVNPEGFKKYITAIHAGHSGDYKPMQAIFEEILEVSLR